MVYWISSRFGLVAQLGERCVRNAEVEGSIPFRSTTSGQSTLCSVFLCRKTSACFLAPPSPQKADGFSGTPEVLMKKARILKHLLHQKRHFSLWKNVFFSSLQSKYIARAKASISQKKHSFECFFILLLSYIPKPKRRITDIVNFLTVGKRIEAIL